MKLTHWLSGLFFSSSPRSASRRFRHPSSRRSHHTEGAVRLAPVERLEERQLLTAAPVFDPTTYTETIGDNSPEDTWVLGVFADDPDLDEVTYQFDSASSGAPFAIDSMIGDITVNGPLDAGTQSQYVLTVEAVDPGGLIGTATVTINLTPGNDPPEPYDDSYSVDESDVLIVSAANGVLANDSDPDGDALTAHLDTGPEYGDLDLLSDGSFSYTPNPGYSGYDGFYYYVSDGTADSDSVWVDTEVLESSTNDLPEVYDDSYTVTQDQTLTILPAGGVQANDSDPDGDALTAHLDTGPSSGGVNLNQDGSFTYTPNADFVGFDSFTYYLRLFRIIGG